LTTYINILLEKQDPNGSWNAYTGIDHGLAGILLFLLSYIENTLIATKGIQLSKPWNGWKIHPKTGIINTLGL